jgi:hypothetical protein
MDNSNCIEKIVNHSKNNLDLKKQLSDEYFYKHLGLCVIDSIFSINAQYRAVQNVVERYSNHTKIEKFRADKTKESLPKKKEQKSISEFLAVFNTPLNQCVCGTQKYCNNLCLSCAKFAEETLKNSQRTSTTNGILKVCAVKQFLQILKENKIEYFQDLHGIFDNQGKMCNLENRIKSLKGQGSGISFKYFLMLAGKDDLIKPDRMIKGYLSSILNVKEEILSDEQCLSLLTECFQYLKNDDLTSLRQYDHVIWSYQRAKEKSGR